MKKILQFLIKAYALAVSPLMARSCRYHPTCSCYAHEAIEKHGALKGLYLTIARILRCHPWNKRPYLDPVPETFQTPIDRIKAIGYKRKQSINNAK